jgi:hypothetical protein
MSHNGLIVRAFPKAQFLRGWYPQTPNTRTHSFPIASLFKGNNPKDFIFRGSVISTTEDGDKWVKGVPTGTTHNPIIAIAQNDEWQDDVQNAGQLVGLDCSGQFTIATPFFKHKHDGELCEYTPGTKLTYCLNNETDTIQYLEYANGTQTLVTDDEVKCIGYVRPAKDGEPVIGIVSQKGAGRYTTMDMIRAAENPEIREYVKGLNRDLAGYNLNLKAAGKNLTDNASDFAKMPTGAYPLMFSFGSAVTSDSDISTAYYIVFDTVSTGINTPKQG